MLDKEYFLNFLKAQKAHLKENYGVERIALFGSYARDEQTEESDIDFFVEMPASFHKICALEEYLEYQFRRKVDVIRNHANLRNGFISTIQKDAINV